MAFLKCDITPMNGPGELHWADADAVVEVTESWLVEDLLRIGCFYEVVPTKKEASAAKEVTKTVAAEADKTAAKAEEASEKERWDGVKAAHEEAKAAEVDVTAPPAAPAEEAKPAKAAAKSTAKSTAKK
jgi:hypothetical protein